MQDLKRQSNRRPAVRKLRTSSMSVRKNRSNPIPGLPLKLRKPNTDPSYSNSWIPQFFIINDPTLLRIKMRYLIQKLIGIVGLFFILWLAGGSVWIGQAFFKKPIKKVVIKDNQILENDDVLRMSGLRQGQMLSDVDPYWLAARLQKHPIIKHTDIRRKFPDELHLKILEYEPVAILKIFHQTNNLTNTFLSKKHYVLLGKNQKLLKQLQIDMLKDPQYKSLPLIEGLQVESIKLGTTMDSPVLERGLRFLETFKKMGNSQKNKLMKIQRKHDSKLSIFDWPHHPIHIDISDPLNLKINWPQNNFNLERKSPKQIRTVPLTIQMGSRNFDQRLRTFQNIYPAIGKQHPGLKSIDLRYKNRVLLVP